MLERNHPHVLQGRAGRRIWRLQRGKGKRGRRRRPSILALLVVHKIPLVLSLLLLFFFQFNSSSCSNLRLTCAFLRFWNLEAYLQQPKNHSPAARVHGQTTRHRYPVFTRHPARRPAATTAPPLLVLILLVGTHPTSFEIRMWHKRCVSHTESEKFRGRGDDRWNEGKEGVGEFTCRVESAGAAGWGSKS